MQIQNQKIETAIEPHLANLEEVNKKFPQQKFLLCGSGKKIIAQILQEKKIAFEMGEEADEITADLVGLLALENFKKGEILEDLNPLYLRAPRITERKK